MGSLPCSSVLVWGLLLVNALCYFFTSASSCNCQTGNVTTVCTYKSNYAEAPNCQISCAMSKLRICMDGFSFTGHIPGNFTGHGDRDELKVSCSAGYPIDFKYEGDQPLTAIKLEYGRQQESEDEMYLLNFTVSIISKLLGNFSVFYTQNPALSTTVQILTPPEDLNSSTAGHEPGASPLTISLWDPPSGKPTWIVCSSNLRSSYQRLINLVTNNPTESKYMRDCVFGGNGRCFNRREAGLRLCSVYNLTDYTCKAFDLKPPGGLVSCFTDDYNKTLEYMYGVDEKYYFDENYPMGFPSLPVEALIAVTKYNDSYVSGLSYVFTCTASRYLLAQGLQWYLQYSNGSLVDVLADSINSGPTTDNGFQEPSYMQSTLEIIFSPGVDHVICLGAKYNSEKTVNASVFVDVKESSHPYFKYNDTHQEFSMYELNRLDCNAYGMPLPTVEWTSEDFNITTLNKPLRDYGDHMNLKMIFENDTVFEKPVYKFTCVARNVFGNATKIYRVTVVDRYTGAYSLITGLSALVCSIAVFTFYAVYYCTRQKGVSNKGLTKDEVKEFREGNGVHAQVNDACVGPDALPFKDEYEITESDLQIRKDKVLGRGAFGLVLKGKYQGKQVAVKTLKPCATKVELKSLLTELKVMTFVGEHKNIVKLIGAVTRYLEFGTVYVVVEYCRLGSLNSYIRDNRPYFYDQFNLKSDSKTNYVQFNAEYVRYCNTPNQNGSVKCICTEDLLDWGRQIANGMEFLSRVNVVHGDLALRNVLLADGGVVKISDFGLSRKLYEYVQYVKRSQEPLPWRWMAVESLSDLTFSTESDVWSFGVLLWELFSLAETPYPGLNWSTNFHQALRRGYRLRKPECASAELYEVMWNCWKTNPSERPKFEELEDSLAKIHESVSNNPVTRL